MEDLGPRLMAAATTERDVAVIGGGWAGMAAGVTLAAAGVPVTVFEAARTLGGRARRVVFAGATVDNGQHLLLGAYRATLALIDQVHAPGNADRMFARIPLCLLGPGAFRLRAAPLPAPLHLLAGLLAARGCTLPERLAVVRAFVRWRVARWICGPAQSVAGLVQDQPAAMVAKLWTPLCLAALNTPPGAASGQVFLNVLRDALAAERPASDLIIPVADLSGLFPDPAARYVAERGGRIQLGATVRGLQVGDDAIAVQVAGAAQRFRHVVVAAAPWQAALLLRGVPAAAGACAQIAAYGYQPITTVYLRYAEPVPVPARMLQLGDGPGQWLFDRGRRGRGSRTARHRDQRRRPAPQPGAGRSRARGRQPVARQPARQRATVGTHLDPGDHRAARHACRHPRARASARRPPRLRHLPGGRPHRPGLSGDAGSGGAQRHPRRGRGAGTSLILLRGRRPQMPSRRRRRVPRAPARYNRGASGNGSSITQR
ncbi:MAG: FAD-dependent oxidoreductase [Betaproteobacteria bacterium]|nr:FAD-dependent oxidoreductase [Betaproteobacteria bacterium]